MVTDILSHLTINAAASENKLLCSCTTYNSRKSLCATRPANHILLISLLQLPSSCGYAYTLAQVESSNLQINEKLILEVDKLLSKAQERKTTPMLPSPWIKVLLHFQVGLSLYVIPKWAWRSQPAPISSKEKVLGSHMIGWRYPIHPNTPTMIGWIIGGRVHRKSSARMVTFGGLTLKFPWNPG